MGDRLEAVGAPTAAGFSGPVGETDGLAICVEGVGFPVLKGGLAADAGEMSAGFAGPEVAAFLRSGGAESPEGFARERVGAPSFPVSDGGGSSAGCTATVSALASSGEISSGVSADTASADVSEATTSGSASGSGADGSSGAGVDLDAWTTWAVVWTLGFDPSGGSSGFGAEAVFFGWVGVASFTTSGTGADPGMRRRGRLISGWTGAGAPSLIGGEGTESFSRNTWRAWRADSGRSAGCRLRSHMIHSQAQMGMPSRTSWMGVMWCWRWEAMTSAAVSPSKG